MKWLVPFFLLVLTSCASYQSKIDKPYGQILNRQPLAAAEILKPLAEKDGDDQLVYMLEYGVALHEAGQYQESIKVFLKAYDIVAIKDYHSLSRVAGSILLNEGMVQYKGEDFEKVLVNVYLAINFLALGDLNAAAVEARRVNEILYKFKFEAKKDYDQNPFARYLSGIIWEADRNWDSMYIDYKNTYDLAPLVQMLQPDLLWSSKKARRPEDHEKWQKQFAKVTTDPLKDTKEAGELVVIYQQGQGPQKRPDPGFPRVPKLFPRYTSGVWAKVEVTEDLATPAPPIELKTEKIFSVTDTAIKTLNDQYAALIAKRLGGVVAKAVVSDQIRQKNRLLGDISWLAMNIADRADLRQWATLPESFQLARRMLKPGKYKVRIKALDGSNNLSGESSEEKLVEIKPGKKAFITWRSFK